MDEISNKSALKDGALIVPLSSWNQFHEWASGLKTRRGYVWRGQKKDWPLECSFDREVKTRNQRERAEQLTRHLSNFRKAMNRHHPGLLPEDEDQAWALGQHHRLWTPLLDWTLSPYIAAYFAFIEGTAQKDATDSRRYMYALNRSIERHLSKTKKGNRVPFADRSVPFIDLVPYKSPRFEAQEGILTRAFRGDDIWDYIQSFAEKRPGQLLIVKFSIPTELREDILRHLDSRHIDRLNLRLDHRDDVDLRDIVACCNSQLLLRQGRFCRLMEVAAKTLADRT